MSPFPRFAYSPKAWWSHALILVTYSLILGLLFREFGRYQSVWLSMQDGWVLYPFLAFSLIWGDLWVPTRLHRKFVEGQSGTAPKGVVSPVPTYAWTITAALLVGSSMILLGLPARWFEGYRGCLGGRVSQAFSFTSAKDGRIALDGNTGLFRGNKRVLVVSNYGKWRWSRPLTDYLNRLSWSQDGKLLAVLDCKIEQLSILDGETGETLRNLGGTKVNKFCWLPDGSVLVEVPHGLLRWGLDGSKSMAVEEECLQGFSLSPEGDRIWVRWRCGNSNHLAVRDARSFAVLDQVELPESFFSLQPMWGSDRALVRVLSGGADADAKVWSLKQRRFVAQIPSLKREDAARLSPDGRYLVGRRGDEWNVRILDLQTYTWGSAIPAWANYPESITFSPDGREIWVTGHTSEFLFLWPMAGPIQRWRVPV